jgi:hypothetical protein
MAKVRSKERISLQEVFIILIRAGYIKEMPPRERRHINKKQKPVKCQK